MLDSVGLAPSMLTVESLKKAEKLLRKGRLSIPHTRYFVTCCTEGRQSTLTKCHIGETIRDAWRGLHLEGSINLRCATIMPDHMHILFVLGSRLRLAQVIGKFKAMTKDCLEGEGLSWQSNYYDHRLRAETALESFSRYIFLNPYRDQLITPFESWPWWTCHRAYKPEFLSVLDEPPRPPQQWIQDSVSIAELIEKDLP